MWYIVSVPSRGLIYLNENTALMDDEIREFPSPLGDLYISMETKNEKMEKRIPFPSPLGDLYISIWKEVLYKQILANSFRPLSGTYISQ